MRRGLVIVLVVLAAFAAAGPADALTKSQADAAALRVLKPLAVRGTTVLFGLPQAVRATQSVAVASMKRQGLLPGPKLRAAGEAVWVYWLDLDFGARFEHPGRIVLVDDATGVASRPRATLWYPLVDGRRPAYLRNPAAYTSRRWRVWANVGGSRRIAAAAPPARVPSVLLNAIPPGSFSSDCLLMYGAYNDPFFVDDFVGMSDFAETVGLRQYYSTSTRAAPLADIPARTDVPNNEDFERNVDYLTRLGGCKDILLYLDGHGRKTGAISVSAGDNGEVFESSVRLVLQQHPDVTFKVKIDSCYAGRFATNALFSKPNLLLLEVSSQENEPSFSMLPPELMKKADGTPVRRAVDNPGRGEFTHSNLVGLTAFAESAAEVKAAQTQGGSLLAHMLARAFTLGRSSDGAELSGFTHPSLDTITSGGSGVPLPLASALSHTHPQPNPGYSYVCDKVTTLAGAAITLHITGPGGYTGSSAVTLPAGEKEHVFSFKIGATGDYGFQIDATLGQRTGTLQASYTVPDLATPTGPFTCPPP